MFPTTTKMVTLAVRMAQKMSTVRTSLNLNGWTFLIAMKPASSAPDTT